jgi:MurNAc alpha-1-phosphate uridylyltransferase
MAHLRVAFNAYRHALFRLRGLMDKDTDKNRSGKIRTDAESPCAAMILAAGRGERMRPLSDECPKPLLEAGGRTLIEWHLRRLATAGYGRVVINLGWRGETIRNTLGDGDRFGLEIRYSDEGFPPLETGGGIFRALPLLLPGPFVVLNSDVWTDFPIERLGCPRESLAHLVMIPNPAHNANGDFVLDGSHLRGQGDGPRLTFSGIGVYRAELFEGCKPGRFPLAPVLRSAMDADRVSGELYEGEWRDIGDPARLEELRRDLS